MRQDRSSATSVRPGRILAGKYRVERVIGRGGMGVVVAARHLHLGERVAVKLLRPEARPKPETFERFVREGRAAARMRSEHVARVHDAGVLETGEPYLVLEYLDGQDLRTLLRKRGKLPVETAVVYLLQVCEAVAEAHALGIVHRDLKPGNLFMTRRADGSEAVKVIDFGISKIVASPVALGEDTSLTEQDGAIGTPGYMAPEQMRSARTADARADIWALGAVLYGLLTGNAPFAGETMVAVYDAILRGAPSPRAARPDVPPELDEVVLRCLRVDPEERYQDAGQLAQALAPLAPPAARLHADRAARIAQGRPPAEDAPLADETHEPEADPGSSSGSSVPDALADTMAAFGEGSAPSSLGGEATEITREPSWVRSSERPRAAPVPASPAPRPSRVQRGAIALALGLALATGGVVGWYSRRGDEGVRSASSRDVASGVPGLPLPPASADLPASPAAATETPRPPLSQALIPSATSPSSAAPPARERRPPPPPRAPAASASLSARVVSPPPVPPRLTGLAETPD